MAKQKALASDYILYVVAIIVGIVLIAIAVAVIVADPSAALSSPVVEGIVLLMFFAGSGISGWGARGMHRTSTAKAIEKAAKKVRTADEQVRVYKEADSQSPLVARLPEESELEFGATTEVNGVDWVSVGLPDGRQGYVIGSTRTHSILKVIMEDQEVTVHKGPDPNSPPLSRLPAGSEVELSGTDWERTADGLTWLTVWLPDGQRGYIRSNTKLRWV